LDNYTKTKEAPKSQVKATNNTDISLEHIAETNERLNYIIETLKTHAEIIKLHEDILSRIRTRMGL
tara:strand:- start:278 stop:475 length:198 start_codon:yes stop_codon:yes gene_type:complete